MILANTTEQVFPQMVKEISFLLDELTSNDTAINLLLESLIKCKDNDEKRNILSNHDKENTLSEKKN